MKIPKNLWVATNQPKSHPQTPNGRLYSPQRKNNPNNPQLYYQNPQKKIMAALFLGGLLSVGCFATPQKRKLGLQLKNPDFVAVGGPRRVPPSSPDRAQKTHGFCWPFSSKLPGGKGWKPCGKGELIHMKIGVKVMFLLICMHSKKRKIQSDNQKKQRDLNSKRDSRKWRNAKGFIPQKFSHDVIGTFMKASRHAWIIDVSNWCPQHF